MGNHTFQTETFLKPDILTFIDNLLAITWNRYHKSNTQEVNKLNKDILVITAAMDSKCWLCMMIPPLKHYLCTDFRMGATPSLTELKKHLLQLHRMSIVLVKYQDTNTTNKLAEYVREIDVILAVVQKDLSKVDLIDSTCIIFQCAQD